MCRFCYECMSDNYFVAERFVCRICGTVNPASNQTDDEDLEEDE